MNRVRVFINFPDRPCPLGIPSVQNSTGRRLTSDERAFRDAMADRLGAAISHRSFPGLRDGDPTLTEPG